MTTGTGTLREIQIIKGSPGSGKSHQMIEQCAAEPDRYVLASALIKCLEEHALKFPPNVVVRKVHSGTNGRRRVQDQIKEAWSAIEDAPHCVLLITHHAMTSCDLSALSGAHWLIDEVPTVHASGHITINPGEESFWNSQFYLDHSSDGWSIARFAGERANLVGMKRGLLQSHAGFADAAARGAAYVATEQWTAGRTDWIAVWTPAMLPAPKSICVAGASFSESVCALLLANLWPGETSLVQAETVRPRSGEPNIRIHFGAKWDCTTQHWESYAGRRDLAEFAAHVRQTQPDLGYWASNANAVASLAHHISGEENVEPKLAGINAYDQKTSCAIFYSAKATDDDRVLRGFGIDSAAILRSRETEDIYQFVFRGAIRRPEFGGVYDVWLWSQRQAVELADRLRADGFASVEVMHAVGAGIADAPPPSRPRGRKRARPNETQDERRKRKSAERAEQRRRHKRGMAGPSRAADAAEQPSFDNQGEPK